MLSGKSTKKPLKTFLTYGEHLITFEGNSNIEPMIYEIKIGKEPNKVNINKDKFLTWVKNIQTEKEGASSTIFKKDEKNEDEQNITTAKLPENQSLTVAPDEPYYQYTAYSYAPMTYTFHTSVHLYAGKSYVFTTKDPIGPYADPVMYLYKENKSGNMITTSWVNDDGGGGRMSKITVTITTTADYILMIRAYGTNTGTVDVYQGSTLIANDAPIAGNLYPGNPTLTAGEPYQKVFFIAEGNEGSPWGRVDTYLWVMASATGAVKGENDDCTNFSGVSDYTWPPLSRIYYNASSVSTINYALAALNNPEPPFSNYSVYLHVGTAPSTVKTGLGITLPISPTSILVSSTTNQNNYNSHAWAGGFTSDDPLPHYYSAYNPYWVSPNNNVASFDNYYMNRNATTGIWEPRYWPGTPQSYMRADDGDYTAIILYARNGDGWLNHSAIRNIASYDGHHHGFDYESKLLFEGLYPRIFHSRSLFQVCPTIGYESYYYRIGD